MRIVRNKRGMVLRPSLKDAALKTEQYIQISKNASSRLNTMSFARGGSAQG